ncbi:raqprd family integrative conjugative element protein [Pseudomonas sp. NCIMB 10586]|jgi:RAQPRD family integrative conjugative element protein|nr:raqprd family integrative conjugative element protein [Pseudomonas sp. NCIMB 10586]VCU67807.1 hypothetical protein [Pseudomonas synxantha]
MTTVCFRSVVKRGAVVGAALIMLAPTVVCAAGESLQRTQLALVLRQLDAIERMAQYSRSQPLSTPARYHFDYSRLHQDVQRVRQGIQDYLTPPRAQPRDAVELIGDYREQQETTP